MKPFKGHDIQDLLTDLDPVETPAGLAESIKAEIPEDLTLPAPDSTAAPTPLRRRTWFPVAASLLALVGGGYLASRVLLTSPEPSLLPESVTVTEEITPSQVERSDGVALKAPVNAADLAEKPDLQPAPQDDALGESQIESLGYVVPPAKKSKEVRPPTFVPPSPPETAPAEENRSQRRANQPRRDEVQPVPQAFNQETTSDLIYDAPASPEAEVLQQSPSPQPPRQAKPTPPTTGQGERTRFRLPALHLPPPPPAPRREAPSKAPEPSRQELPKPSISVDVPQLATASNHRLAEVDGAGSQVPPSTGGTTEPNDAPYGDVFFEGYGTNPFIDTEDDHLSTFGLDVDTASYTVVRRYLNDGHLPPKDAVRVEELVNYFEYGDTPPEEAEFALHAEGAPSPFAHGERYYLLRFNLHAREVAAENRPPADLTFVVDVSGSMSQENRLGLVKRALGLLLDELRSDDRIGLVVYGSRGRVVLEPTGDHEAIRRAIMELRPEGSTNAGEGLQLAYELAARHRRDGAIHRVILCSDGVANVGSTSAELILKQVHQEAQQGIELTTVGFGMGNYNDVLMEKLADRGNGRYAYVDTLDEAHRIFVEDLTGTLMTVAAEARSQVEFNPQVVARYRLLGYENRDIADERFRDDTVDAGEIGAGHTVTALYEIKLRQKPSRRRAAGLEIGTLRLRYGSVARGEMVELERTVTGADLVHRWEKASPALRLTSLVAEFAEILKGTYWAREGDLETVFRRAQKVSAEFAGDRDVAEFVSLAGRAAEYKKRQ